jgi:lipopolysaccharide biosynthesis regulator YciM
MGAALVLVLVGLGALAAGVLLGRYYVPDDRMLRRTARHSRAYMRALNHLLAREHDIVITELRRVVEENVEDAEPYFALGALFRSRGEHERAIRVHQALAVREAGNKKLRLRARYALGLDFRAAGMPRRATRAMEEVLADDGKHEGALRALCGLYEEQGLYAEAAENWERLSRRQGEGPPRRQHHLLCAAAQAAISDGKPAEARRFLDEARRIGPESAHLVTAAAELAAATGEPEVASARLREALALAPDLAPYLVPGLLAAELAALPPPPPSLPTGQADRERLALTRTVGHLDALAAGGNDPHLRLAAAELREPIDPAAAGAAYRAIAADHPRHLPARAAAARLALADGDPTAIAAELAALVGPGGALALAATWRCAHCGHRPLAFTWRCPSCRRWASTRRDAGGDTPAPIAPPRERRERPRPPTAALLAPATPALPAASPGSDPSPGPLQRVARWISGPWSGKRSRAPMPTAED